MRNGAFDYLTKPFDLEQVAAVIDRALTHRRAEGAPAITDTMAVESDLLGRSPAMQEVFKRIALVAPTDASVLIMVKVGRARSWWCGPFIDIRAARPPFIPIHLASLSPTLVESELFGHVPGAFTGADNARQGLLELADGATVFFDEAGDIPGSRASEAVARAGTA